MNCVGTSPFATYFSVHIDSLCTCTYINMKRNRYDLGSLNIIINFSSTFGQNL